MATENLKVASVLAFERKLDPSDGLFYTGAWDNKSNASQWRALSIREKAIRGTISNRLKNKKDEDPMKLDAAIENPNLQRVDVVTLPNNCDTLKVRFTLRILGNVELPNTCNDAAYQDKLQETVKQYIAEQGFEEISKRYAINLANARFLWRNRVGAEAVEVHISHITNGEAEIIGKFDAFKFSLRDFSVPAEYQASIRNLANLISNGLKDNQYTLLEVVAYVRVGEGQEVFPSQELVLDQGNSKKGKKSRTLYAIEGVAAMHSQKIGNAIRTIDNWHSEAEELGPISVEPYGSVTSRGKAYRKPTDKVDFYSLFDNWVIRDKKPGIGDQHYVIANLIRGGVFGESGKE